jgi:hypothetical protein
MKMGRNKPCWCGSGQKFKRCHLGREEQARPHPYESAHRVQKNFSKEFCSVPNQLKHECSKRIVRAHTVSKSSGLRAISHDGHVYKTLVTPDVLFQNKGRPEPQRVGINRASTFTGFCSIHDQALFSPFENHPFEASQEQVFLLAYRALCYEWYTKSALVNSIPVFKELDKGMPLQRQADIQNLTYAYGLGAQAGLEQTSRYKEKFDEMLLSKRFCDIQFYCLELDQVPEIVGGGGFNPEFDLNQVQLQDLGDLDIRPDILFFSSFESENRGYICFIWHQGMGPTCRLFIESFMALPNDQKPNAALQTLLSNSENMFLKPEWWECKSRSERDAVIQRVRQGSPFAERIPLFDDKINLTACTITRIIKNF